MDGSGKCHRIDGCLFDAGDYKHKERTVIMVVYFFPTVFCLVVLEKLCNKQEVRI